VRETGSVVRNFKMWVVSWSRNSSLFLHHCLVIGPCVQADELSARPCASLLLGSVCMHLPFLRRVLCFFHFLLLRPLSWGHIFFSRSWSQTLFICFRLLRSEAKIDTV
jgi:hypothetical protein